MASRGESGVAVRIGRDGPDIPPTNTRSAPRGTFRQPANGDANGRKSSKCQRRPQFGSIQFNPFKPSNSSPISPPSTSITIHNHPHHVFLHKLDSIPHRQAPSSTSLPPLRPESQAGDPMAKKLMAKKASGSNGSTVQSATATHSPHNSPSFPCLPVSIHNHIHSLVRGKLRPFTTPASKVESVANLSGHLASIQQLAPAGLPRLLSPCRPAIVGPNPSV